MYFMPHVSMKYFGISKQGISVKKTFKPISLIFIFCLLVVFSLFLLYNKISLFLFQRDKIDIFKEDLHQIAIYFLPVDKQVAQFLVNIDSTIKGYIKGENILITKEKNIEDSWEYVKNNKEYLKKL